MTTPKTRMLTAQELVQIRVKVDKSLPTKGTKEFRPSNSWLEKKQIQTALDERKILLEEERVERLGALTRAEWDPELKVANVTCKMGRHWKQMGHEVGGKLYLLPEEALFLLETTCLELLHNGIAMSIQDGYSTLLGPNTGCTFNEYQTYVHLVRQGYIVLRHSKSIKATRYERQIRLHQYSVGQKQHKTKENASVQEIFIEDGEIGAKGNILDVKSPSSSDSIKNNMKIEEQEIIDLEAIEASNVNDDKALAKGIVEMNGVSESGSIEQFVPRRKSSECDNINSNSIVSNKTVRLEAVEKDINIVTENEGGKEALKDETLVQEKDSQRRSVLGYHKGNHTQTCKTDLEIIAPVHEPAESGENEKRVDEDRGSSPELQSESCSVCSERDESEIVSGITKESRGSKAVENVTVSNLEEPDSGIHPQYEHGSEDINIINEIPLSHLTVSKGGNSVSESVKALEQTSDKMADVMVVDDSSTSVIVGQKEHSSELDVQQIEHEGEEKQKQLAGDQNVTQKPEKEFTDWNDVVDVSDSSQTSHTEIKIECSSKIRRCDTQSKTSLGNNDEIEIVNIVDVKGEVDNEIIEVNNKEAPSASHTRSRRRRSYQNHERRNAVKTEIQVSQNNRTSVKANVVDAANDAVANVTLLSSVQNLNPDHSHRHRSKDISCLGKGKVTSIHLEHDEVEITPSIIDITEEQGKLEPSNFKEEEANSICRSEIEVVDVEDEDMRPKLSWEEERKRILDTIPSMDGKFMIHVRVPDKDLLPPNTFPQKKDYYIQKYRLSAPGIGGKLRDNLPNDRACQWQNDWPLQSGGQINPWIQNPTHNLGGGGNVFGAAGMWNNSTFLMPGPFVNQHYQAPFPGRYEMQNAFHQAVAVMSVLGNPALGYNQMFGMPAVAPVPQHSRILYRHRPLWHYQTRPRYRRPYYRRGGWRCGVRYFRRPVKLGKHFENQGSSSNNIIPLCVGDEIRAGAQRAPPKNEVKLNDGDDDDDDDNDDDDDDDHDDDDDDNDDDDVIECVSVSSPVKVEDEPMEWKSSEGERHGSNTNGIDRPDVGVHQKRKISKNTKRSEPPKKLWAYIENEEKRRKDVLKNEVQNKESHQEVLQQEDMAAADVKSWRDFKTVMQVVVLDSSSDEENDVHVVVDDPQGPEMEINKPLVQPEDCKDIGLILKKLQIIKSMNIEQERQCGKNERLKISFDLYLPTTTFRKASPGLPNYRITVVGYEDPMPEPKEIVALLKDYQDDVPLLFAVVLPNTVTFLQFGSVTLPVETFCP